MEIVPYLPNFASMNRGLSVFVGLVIWLLIGCGAKPLERQGVEIIWGMRVNAPEDWLELRANLLTMDSLDMHALMIELPLKADSLGDPRIFCLPGKADLALLKSANLRLNLGFCTTKSDDLWYEDEALKLYDWNDSMQVELRRALNCFKNISLERVVIGPGSATDRFNGGAWKNLIAVGKTIAPNCRFSIAADREMLEKSEASAVSDELSIDCKILIPDEFKTASRSEHQRIASFASHMDKPVFLFRSNILGEQAMLQIKNRLRFWPDDLVVSGLCLNSLYPKITLRDQNPYYGTQDEPETAAFLVQYCHRSED